MIFEKFVLNKYKKILLTRLEPKDSIKYFTKEDFPGLMSDDFSFSGEYGQRLSAHIYYREGASDGKLIIFEHGMGCGHIAYMTEINLLTEHGYRVATYDKTGCTESEGENIVGFSQSLSDLNAFINHIKSTPELSGMELCVIGHSWGGYTAMNIPSLHPDITHIVSLSGFVSARMIIDQQLFGFLRHYRNAVYKFEKETLPRYADLDARSSLSDVKTQALLIHSKNDHIVTYDLHFKALIEKFENNPRVRLVTVDGKYHNPNYTAEAVGLLNIFQQEHKRLSKRGLLNTPEKNREFAESYDWRAIVEQDMQIWSMIFDFING